MAFVIHPGQAHGNGLVKLEDAAIFVVNQAQGDRVKTVFAIQITAADKAFQAVAI
jgi:hypothetical protein